MLRRLTRLSGRATILALLVCVTLPVGAAVAVVAAVSTGQVCSLVGGINGVSVDLGFKPADPLRYLRDHPSLERRYGFERAYQRAATHIAETSEVRRVVICVDQHCIRRNTGQLGPPATTVHTSGPGTVDVTVAIDRRHSPLQFARGRVKLERFEPNGPGCGTWWNAGVRVQGNRVLPD